MKYLKYITLMITVILLAYLAGCTDAYAPIDTIEDEPEISEPALHPFCASSPDSLNPQDIAGKDEITEIVYRIDSIDTENQQVWCEPTWSETGQTVCTGNEWRDYGIWDFTLACRETFEPYVIFDCP